MKKILIVAAIAIVILSQPASASTFSCNPKGDIDQNTTIDVVDVQCAVKIVLWDLYGKVEPIPECVKTSWLDADMNCDGKVSISDLNLLINKSIEEPFEIDVDADQNGIVDTCENSSENKLRWQFTGMQTSYLKLPGEENWTIGTHKEVSLLEEYSDVTLKGKCNLANDDLFEFSETQKLDSVDIDNPSITIQLPDEPKLCTATIEITCSPENELCLKSPTISLYHRTISAGTFGDLQISLAKTGAWCVVGVAETDESLTDASWLYDSDIPPYMDN